MESGIDVKSLDRFFKLIASVVTLVTTGKRNIGRVCNELQKIVDESQKVFEIYIAVDQENGNAMTGFDLERHLTIVGLMGRCASLEDLLIKGWIANPSTYPEELKKKNIFLWRHAVTSGGFRRVACLVWEPVHCRVEVKWRWLRHEWTAESPALLLRSRS